MWMSDEMWDKINTHMDETDSLMPWVGGEATYFISASYFHRGLCISEGTMATTDSQEGAYEVANTLKKRGFVEVRVRKVEQDMLAPRERLSWSNE